MYHRAIRRAGQAAHASEPACFIAQNLKNEETTLFQQTADFSIFDSRSNIILLSSNTNLLHYQASKVLRQPIKMAMLCQ